MAYFKKTATNLAIANKGNTAKDTAVPADATDTIAAVRWSPVANHLAAASWDGKVRIYDVTSSSAVANTTDRSARGLAQITAEGPLFSCDWYKDGSIVAAAGADKKVHLLDAASGQTASFAAHDAPIRSARFVDVRGSSSPILATGSWDRTLRYWDLRADPASSGPLAAVPCGERVYSMDSAGTLLVVATADRMVHLVDLAADPTRPLRSRKSALAHQTRVVAAFPDGKGWGTASIEGRAAINIVDEKLDTTGHDAFTFKCHRITPVKGPVKVWAVNDMNFHPTNDDIFTTAGSDGAFCFWNRKTRIRTKIFEIASSSSSSSSGTDSKKSEDDNDVVGVTATAFSRADGGKTFAYATGYDWSQGYARNSASLPTRLVLHPVAEDDLRKQ